MIRIALPIIALVFSGPAFAQDEAVETVASVPTAPPAVSSALTLTLQSNTPMEQNATLYQCDDNTTLSVQYINAAPNFLALVPVDGVVHLFATALSASGARYVSGPFEWWSTGDEATLRDLTQGEDAEPLTTCTASNNTP